MPYSLPNAACKNELSLGVSKMVPLFLKRKSKSGTPNLLPLGLSPMTSALLARLVDVPTCLWTLQIRMESPPIVLYGTPVDLAGAIVSGLIFLDTTDDATKIDFVTLKIVQRIRYSKPFMISLTSVTLCKDCQVRSTDISRWNVVNAPTVFNKGRHAYPFSDLLPGLLPPLSKLGSASTNTYIQYDLIAEAKGTDDSHVTTVKIPLHISRLIPRGPDRNSLRVFPPTEVTAGAVLPHVFYPKLSFPIELRLDNIVSASGERRWRMRKLAWKIEENVKIRAYTCPKHKHKLEAVEASERKTRLLNVQNHIVQSKGGNLHHLTIQTNMLLLRNPSQYNGRNVEGVQQGSGGNQDELIEPEEEHQHQVEDAYDSFVEDFVRSGFRLALLMREAREQEQTQRRRNFEENNTEHIYLEETRVVSHGEIKSGWKLDFSNRGKVELVAHIDVYDFFTGWQKPVTTKSSTEDNRSDLSHQNARANANVACDVDDPESGIFVTHTLVVEVVVAEEVVHDVNKRPAMKKSKSQMSVASQENSDTYETGPPVAGIPTGAARVLRMQFKMPLTERLGLGIAWDDEVPPIYEDIRCLSPPGYNDITTKVDFPDNTEHEVVMSTSPTLGAISRVHTETNLKALGQDFSLNT